jgi:hypothetical protein
LRDLSLADPMRPAQVDLIDLAKADQLPVRETRFDCTFTNLATSDNVQYHGLSYETPAVLRARMPDVVAPGWSAGSCPFTVTPLARPAAANAVGGTLVNVSSVTLDGDQMGLDPSRPVDLSGIKSATPFKVYLVWARGRRTPTIQSSACAGSAALRFHLHHPRGLRVVRATLRVDGRRRLVLHGRSLHEISIPRPAGRRFTVTIKTRLRDGATIRSVRHFAACTKTKPKINVTHPRR